MGSRKEIKIPEPSETLAEFLGILLGDGSVPNKYQVIISYNYKTESGYADYIAKIILDLFGLKSGIHIRPKKGCGDILISSRSLVNFLLFFDLLVLLGFRPREYGMRVHLYSQDETLKYSREIGTCNPWHKARFEEFCEDRELEQSLMAIS